MSIWILIFSFFQVFAANDEVSWEKLGQPWREPICVKESVIPMTAKKALSEAKALQNLILREQKVRKIKAISYGRSQPNPELLVSLRELLVLRGLVARRAQHNSKGHLRRVKDMAGQAFAVCSRVLAKFPDVKCHDFLLVSIRPREFVQLVGRHFSEYEKSSIYMFDMKDQCAMYSSDHKREVDENCLSLAADYFRANYLKSCSRGKFEDPSSNRFQAHSIKK